MFYTLYQFPSNRRSLLFISRLPVYDFGMIIYHVTSNISNGNSHILNTEKMLSSVSLGHILGHTSKNGSVVLVADKIEHPEQLDAVN